MKQLQLLVATNVAKQLQLPVAARDRHTNGAKQLQPLVATYGTKQLQRDSDTKVGRLCFANCAQSKCRSVAASQLYEAYFAYFAYFVVDAHAQT